MKRLCIGLGILLLFVVVFGVYWLRHSDISKETPPPTPVASPMVAVTPLSADVSLLAADAQSPWVVIASTTSASDGSTVKTSSDGRAIVAREATIISSLDNNTELTLNFGPDKKQSHFTLIAGKIWSKVARALEQDEVFEIYTPTMVAAVRGTSFGVSLDPKRSLIVSEGTVWISRRDAQTGEIVASSTIAVSAGYAVEDDGTHFIVRPISADDRNDWYLENNPEPGTPTPKNSLDQFIKDATTAPIIETSPITNSPPVITQSPTISSVSPRQFDPRTVSIVRITGGNLAAVTSVLLNKKSTEFAVTNVGVIVINTTEFIDGDGSYDLEVASPAGTALLKSAFTVQSTVSSLSITRTLFAIDQTQATYIDIQGTGLDRVDAVLVAGEPMSFGVLSSSELKVPYPRSDTAVSVEVHAGTQQATSKVAP